MFIIIKGSFKIGSVTKTVVKCNTYYLGRSIKNLRKKMLPFSPLSAFFKTSLSPAFSVLFLWFFPQMEMFQPNYFPNDFFLVLLVAHVSFVQSCNTSCFETEEGVALFGHVIKNITTDRPIKCRIECVNLPRCMSINTRQNEAGTTTCETSDSSKAANLLDLKARPGLQYRQLAVS